MNLRLVATASLAALLSTGCSLKLLKRDTSVHSIVEQLQSPEFKDKVGIVSKAELTSSDDLRAGTVMYAVGNGARFDAMEVRLSSGSPTRLCFQTGFLVNAIDSKDEVTAQVKADLPGLRLSIRAHSSLADFAEGAPWPQANVTHPEGRVLGVELVKGKKSRNSDGEMTSTMDRRQVTVEFCGPPPALGPEAKFLSLVSLHDDESENHIALWELTN